MDIVFAAGLGSQEDIGGTVGSVVAVRIFESQQPRISHTQQLSAVKEHPHRAVLG